MHSFYRPIITSITTIVYEFAMAKVLREPFPRMLQRQSLNDETEKWLYLLQLQLLRAAKLLATAMLIS